MENFTAFNPTKLIFGKDVISKLSKSIKPYGKNVLLVYGKGSIKKNGIYDSVLEQLKIANCNVFEYSGIKSNPVIDDVRKAIVYAKENKIDVIVAVGGGSVVDSAKLISLCVLEDIEPWDIVKYQASPKNAIPLIAVLTVAATGTEMNMFAVVQNHETNEKIGFGHPLMFPKISFLDPQYTYSVSKENTAYGISDIIAHSLEAFFAKGEARLSDRIIATIIKECMHYASLLLNDLTNYDYRANIMWAATSALNGNTAHGKASSGDWGVHDIGHLISLLYDTPHGETLSIVYPAWLKLQAKKKNSRVVDLAELLYGIRDMEVMIEKLEEFYTLISCSVRLKENMNKEQILTLMYKNKPSGMNFKLEEEDYIALLELML